MFSPTLHTTLRLRTKPRNFWQSSIMYVIGNNINRFIVSSLVCIICIIVIMFIILNNTNMTIMCFQLHYRQADIQHSSLRTMAKDVRRAMLPNNDEVLKNLSQKVRNKTINFPSATYDFASCDFQVWMEIRSLIFTGPIQ
jgi:hypothetical protein